VTEGTWEGWRLAESPIRRGLGIDGPLPRLPATGSARSAARQFSSFPSSLRQQNRLQSYARWCFSSQPSTAAPPAAPVFRLVICIEAQTLFPRRRTWRAASHEPRPGIGLGPSFGSQPHPRRGAFPPTSPRLPEPRFHPPSIINPIDSRPRTR
jgi:hypothetical protein